MEGLNDFDRRKDDIFEKTESGDDFSKIESDIVKYIHVKNQTPVILDLSQNTIYTIARRPVAKETREQRE